MTNPKVHSCSIYKTNDYYKIVTESETTVKYFLGGEPVFLVSVNSFEQLQKSIFESLYSSKLGVPTPSLDELKIHNTNLLKKIKETSYTSLYKKCNSVSLRVNKDVLNIAPMKFYNVLKPSKGLVPVMDDIVLISDPFNKKNEVTSAIVQLLEKDYRTFTA